VFLISFVDISVYLALEFGEESHWRSIAFVSLYFACRLLVERFSEEPQLNTRRAAIFFTLFHGNSSLCFCVPSPRTLHFDIVLNSLIFFGCLVSDASMLALLCSFVLVRWVSSEVYQHCGGWVGVQAKRYARALDLRWGPVEVELVHFQRSKCLTKNLHPLKSGIPSTSLNSAF
jgi:hypothetical protein